MRDAMRARGSALRQILRKWKIVERNHFAFWVAQPTFWDVSSNLANARVAFMERVCGQLAIRMGDLVAPHPQPTPSEHVVLGPRASAGFTWVQLGFRLMRSCCCCCCSIDLDQWAEELVHRADRFVAGRWTELVRESTQHQVATTPLCDRIEEPDREHGGKATQKEHQGKVGTKRRCHFQRIKLREKRPPWNISTLMCRVSSIGSMKVGNRATLAGHLFSLCDPRRSR